jgi:ABC-type transport system substrate-binding protein
VGKVILSHRQPPSRSRRGAGVAIALVLTVATLVARASTAQHGGLSVAVAAGPDSVKIAIGAAETLDPAAQGDIGSAAISAQLFESVTAFDPQLQVRPALAASWDLLDGGRRIVFHLRPNLTFSDGSALTSNDVVRSWLRIVDPAHPSPLVSLTSNVDGALAYARGENPDPASVGLSASGDDVEVRLTRPASDFAAIVASPTFAIVPPGIDRGPAALLPQGFVGSGAYTLAADSPASTTLRGSATTRRSGRSSARTRRSRSTTTASTRRVRRSTT